VPLILVKPAVGSGRTELLENGSAVRYLAAVLSLALVLAATPGFADQVFAAQRIVEVEAPANSKGIPDFKARHVSQVLVPQGGEAEAKGLKLPLPVLPKGCATHGTVRYLLLFKGRTKLALPHSNAGRGTSTEAAYAQLVEAITAAAGFHEERMRAVSEAQLWSAERAALVSDNPFLRVLAAHFLKTHGAAAVVDETWGAPGSEQRKKADADSAIPTPTCSQ
jgi:hypothetical protein